MTKPVLAFAAAVLSAIPTARQASAVIAMPTPIVGGNGHVVIGEQYFGGTTSYFVDVLDNSAVSALMISTNDLFGEAMTNMPAWYAYSDEIPGFPDQYQSVFSSAQWDAGLTFSLGNPQGGDGAVVHTDELGTFASLFGSDRGVMIFSLFHTDYAITEANDDDEAPHFFLASSPSSEFLALGGNGAILDGSLVVAAVPEAGSWAFGALALAVGGVSWRFRRRQASGQSQRSWQPRVR